MKIISREEAKEKGLKRYFTGVKCRNGHLSERSANQGNCLECQKEYRESDVYKSYLKKYRKTDYFQSYQKEYRKTDACRESNKKSHLKYSNARKSRLYFGNNKHNIEVISNCEKCNSANQVEAHHHDYDLPMDVTFLCRSCHEGWHIHNTPLNRETGIFTK
jgi:adenosine deaminase